MSDKAQHKMSLGAKVLNPAAIRIKRICLLLEHKMYLSHFI